MKNLEKPKINGEPYLTEQTDAGINDAKIIENNTKKIIDVLLDSPFYLTLPIKERKEIIERMKMIISDQLDEELKTINTVSGPRGGNA